MLDGYQQQSDILDFVKTVPLDGEMTIVFPIEAKSVVVIAMFPVEINDPRPFRKYRPIYQPLNEEDYDTNF